MKTRDAYVAISDPTRREILELVARKEVVSAGAVATAFPGVTRPAISRHLRILRECGVVHTIRHGKTNNYSLNPKPLDEIREGWLAKFGDMPVRSLARLRNLVESNGS